jgi:hypothetical protein
MLMAISSLLHGRKSLRIKILIFRNALYSLTWLVIYLLILQFCTTYEVIQYRMRHGGTSTTWKDDGGNGCVLI